MARNDGVDRCCVMHAKLTAAKIRSVQRHNEREKDAYKNPDIITERTPMNIHFKQPEGGYQQIFDRMEASGEISSFGLQKKANRFGELVFDVNSAYFYNHGGYEFAKQFYADAYQAAIKIAGGEQYILSAVMHADEINRGLTEQLGEDVYHYHMHVVYIPVVEKQILWPQTCEDEKLRGTVRKTVMQVSCSRKWAGQPARDEQGNQLYTRNGKKIFINSYTLLQDYFFRAMREAGYDDIERGEPGSTEHHLTVAQFKVEKEKEKLAVVTQQVEQQTQLADSLGGKIRQIQKQNASIKKIEAIDPRSIPLSTKVILDRSEYEELSIGARKYAAMEKQDQNLQRRLDEADRQIAALNEQVSVQLAEISRYRSVARKLNQAGMEEELEQLRGKLRAYEAAIDENNLRHFFRQNKEKTEPKR